MKEHLFKAKRIDNDEWIIGDGIHYPKSLNYKGTCWIDGMHEKANDWIPVNPSTVCEYTGLPDKNEAKIFEGDELSEIATNTTYLVIYSDGGFKAVMENIEFELSEVNEDVEVVDNIHDKLECE